MSAAGRITPPTRRPPADPTPVRDGIGVSAERPDGRLKVKGEFAYSSDLWARDMLWGATCRSPYPAALIRSIDVSAARRSAGVQAVLTHADVPGRKTYGLEVPDQPVLAFDEVRYQGEPVALVAADHPEAARRAAALIDVEYEVLEPLVDPELAIAGGGRRLHPGGNVLRHIEMRRGDVDRLAGSAAVVVTGEYEVGMQDQAFLGPESGLAIPSGDGGVDLYISTQWLHADRDQVAASLGLPAEQVRLTLAGVGGAFGGREDVSMQVHACMLALRTGRPVKMMYGREESFFGHVHRHPAWMRYEHGATAEGKLLYVRARIVIDGGAYQSTSYPVCGNAAAFAVGPYKCDHTSIEAWCTFTNNPPCGAMRGFGSVQAAFGAEAQMDKLAAALKMDPVELRILNAMSTGDRLPTGQQVHGPAPIAELLGRVRDMPLPGPASADGYDLRELPGGVSNTTHGEGIRRGVGYGVSIKNVCFGAGWDEYSTARVRLVPSGGEAVAEVITSACEVGQGLVTLQAQIARTELGVARAFVHTADTDAGNAGSSSASRQSWMTGGAVKAACEAIRERVIERALQRLGEVDPDAVLEQGQLVSREHGPLVALVDLLDDGPIEEERTFRPRNTVALDERGQGDAHVSWAFSVHRAVVDVDTDLGLTRVVELATAQDVGKAINPQAVEGQIEGGSAQGMGLALMEEIQLEGGRLLNPSFTDYLIPTILDMPPMRVDVFELPQPEAPYGLNGVGEPPTISAGPAVVAAIRAATRRALPRVPVRPEHIVDLGGPS